MTIDLCPCDSKKAYRMCCQSFHLKKQLPPTALHLMRSRYSGFAKHYYEYIIHTTHTDNPAYRLDFHEWTKDIKKFCDTMTFDGLMILDYQTISEEEEFVTFKAKLSKNNKDCSFIEKSEFKKENGKWLYLNGIIQ